MHRGKFVDGSRLAEVRAGSAEEIQDKVLSELGIELFSTRLKEGVGFGLKDDEVWKVDLEEMTADGPLSGFVMDDVGVRKWVRDALGEAVDALLSGESCNQLQPLARMLDSQETYWISESLDLLEESLSPKSEWRKYYEWNTKPARKGVWGQIAALESTVPSTPYRRLNADSLVDFEEDLYSSIEQMESILEAIEASDLTADSIPGDEDPQKVFESMVRDAGRMRDALRSIRSISGSRDLKTVAEAHDNVASDLKVMVLVKALVSPDRVGEENAQL